MIKSIFTTLLLLLATTFAWAEGTVLWSKGQLESIRTAVAKGDARYSDAYKKLITDANKELRREPRSVVNKQGVPPSGDKHDYMSLARYWWPNPDTKDGLPYVRHDGKSNPELENYDRTELGGFATSTATLTLAYYLSGEQKYADKAAELVRVWFLNPATKMNPNMNYAQVVKGHDNNMGRAEGVLDTYSLVEATEAIELLAERRVLSRKEVEKIRGWFGDYARWMSESESGKGEYLAKNNHGLAYDVQHARFLIFAGDSKGAEVVVREFPSVRLATQIDEQGKQPHELARTLGYFYSTFNLTHVLDMADLASALGIDLFAISDGRIDRALEYLVGFIGKQSEFPYQQIKDWSGVEKSLARNLYRAAAYSPHKDRYMELYRANAQSPEDARFVLLKMK